MGSSVTTEPYRIGDYIVTGSYVVDLRDQPPDQFTDCTETDWRALSWRAVGRPYKVEKWAAEKKQYEAAHGEPLPVSGQDVGIRVLQRGSNLMKASS